MVKKHRVFFLSALLLLSGCYVVNFFKKKKNSSSAESEQTLQALDGVAPAVPVDKDDRKAKKHAVSLPGFARGSCLLSQQLHDGVSAISAGLSLGLEEAFQQTFVLT